ncbi:hypothetical protein AB0B10_25925 [Micromonospora arborensis]|uniref:hypothetical protein n=1 Tax=Micromonospora arborensis TaxID=2116518 RepID=UPI00340752C9
MTISGRRWTRPERVHPMWCDVARCNSLYAGLLQEHRSQALRSHVPGLGPVVATLTQRPGGPVRVDLTMSVAIPNEVYAAWGRPASPRGTAPGEGERDVAFVDQLVSDLAHTVRRATLNARADAIPSGPRAPRAATK